MAAHPLTIEDLIARAVQAGEIVEGVNDNKTLLERMAQISKLLTEVNSLLPATERTNLHRERSPEVELLAKALRIAGSPERLAEWMQTAVPALNGQMPYFLMQTEQGRKEVEDVLGRIEHGVY